ncbi:MAG: LysM peptidoglycan-binding domain-containing protein [Bacteroidota bacterium]
MELKKVKIESFKDPDCNQAMPNGTIEAFINPKEYTKSIKIDYTKKSVINDSQPTWVFSKVSSENLTLGEFIVDGTGLVNNNATINNQDVDGYIKKFQDIVSKYNGETHGPPYLKITWGKLLFVCVCQSFNVKYTLFKPDGTALRAEITLGLINTVDWSTKVMEAQRSSPDLTHVRTVKAGDTIPLMAYQIYGDSAYYLDIARVNKLNHVNDIKPGDQLYFPPLKK